MDPQVRRRSKLSKRPLNTSWEDDSDEDSTTSRRSKSVRQEVHRPGYGVTPRIPRVPSPAGLGHGEEDRENAAGGRNGEEVEQNPVITSITGNYQNPPRPSSRSQAPPSGPEPTRKTSAPITSRRAQEQESEASSSASSRPRNVNRDREVDPEIHRQQLVDSIGERRRDSSDSFSSRRNLSSNHDCDSGSRRSTHQSNYDASPPDHSSSSKSRSRNHHDHNHNSSRDRERDREKRGSMESSRDSRESTRSKGSSSSSSSVPESRPRERKDQERRHRPTTSKWESGGSSRFQVPVAVPVPGSSSSGVGSQTGRPGYGSRRNASEEEGMETDVEHNMPDPDENPPISNFFEFTSTALPEVPQPNAMTAEIRHKPVNPPQKAHYKTLPPEKEFEYGHPNNRFKTIPVYNVKRTKGSDEESSEEEEDDDREEIALDNHAHGTRYLQRRHVYKKYDFLNRRVDASGLAVADKRDQILRCLEESRVLIVEGFTGCGKTTQIPQYILDKCREDGRVCNIAVTQPRKLAAITVAKRVCFERNWPLGSIVGYQVSMENKTDRNDTLLTFMTTGVLKQKLISQKSLKEYTHIIIDEVHERDLESDFLLLLIKKIMGSDLQGEEHHVKLILMSATIETEKFENYFVQEEHGETMRPQVVKIPFQSRHRVVEYYLNDIVKDKPDLLNVIDSNLTKEKACLQDEIYDVAVSLVMKFDKMEQEENPDLRVRQRPQMNTSDFPNIRGAVLVFLPGMEEIKRLEIALDRADKQFKQQQRDDRIRDAFGYKWVILKLHSSIAHDEQNRVFENPGDGFRKIILSTNIAESSITVPDIAYVIDFCLTKTLCVDKTTNLTTLQLAWAAQSQCIQRKGRSGRVADGKVFRLLPKEFYQSLNKEIEPEMLHSNLDKVILDCKKFGMDSPQNLLCDALAMPSVNNIERAVSTLKQLGALTIDMIDPATKNKKFDRYDGDLTFIGKVMTDLPVPLQCTRLILFGHCFGVMQEAIIIAAALNGKSLFQSGFQKELDTYLEKMKHAKKSFSDLFAFYHVYKFWQLKYDQTTKPMQDAYHWAKGAGVHLAVLKEVKSTITLIEERLKRLGITESYSLQSERSPTADPLELSDMQGMFLKLAVAGAFYPNYFLRRRPDLRQFEKHINKEINIREAFKTVYFKDFPAYHDGELYAKTISDKLSTGLTVPAVTFDGQKVLATFDNSIGESIGPFSVGLFRAIKMRQLRMEQWELTLLRKEDERREKARQDHDRRRRVWTPCPPVRPMPPVDVGETEVRVQYINSPSQFWVTLECDFNNLDRMYKYCNNDYLREAPLFPKSKMYVNALCLAPYEGCYFRGKILRLDTYCNKSLIQFVDYGNASWVSNDRLYDFSPRMIKEGIHKDPCLAVECRLKNIKPNIVLGLHWSAQSIQKMKKLTVRAPTLSYEIFSVVKGVVIGELFGCSEYERCSLNNYLMRKNDNGKMFGEWTSEPFLSMENNRVRQRAKHMTPREVEDASSKQEGGSPLNLDFYDPPTNGKTPVTLKGPWSPLEMNFQALIHCSNTKKVRIENSSVNSILLDHEPTTPNSRLLVAAHAKVVDKSQVVMVGESTIMAAVPGLLGLICLIFGPKVELRTDKNQTKYTGLLCGCGTIPTEPNSKEAVHPDNDMEIVFDTEIDDQDIDRINIIRGNLNLILRQDPGVDKVECHKRLRDEFLRLLRRSRKKIVEEIWPQEEYCWKSISKEFLQDNSADLIASMYQHLDIYEPNQKIKLDRMAVEDLTWEGGY